MEEKKLEEEQAQKITTSGARVILSSRKKMLRLGIIVALLNPIFAGVVVAAFYLTEAELRREGKIVAGLAIVWGALLFYLIGHYAPPMPFNL